MTEIENVLSARLGAKAFSWVLSFNDYSKPMRLFLRNLYFQNKESIAGEVEQ